MDTTLEERLAHLTRMAEELSDIVARQERDLDRLKRQVAALIEREAARDAERPGGVALGDERPPHY